MTRGCQQIAGDHAHQPGEPDGEPLERYQPAVDSQTLAFYEENAQAFIADTVDSSMGEILARFLAEIPAGGRVLDWGCGSGRDSLAMVKAGYRVDAVDASPAMCAAAHALTGLDVACASFGELVAREAYDGIWASASLLHVARRDMPLVFSVAACALKPGGVLYCSFKLGDFEGMRAGRRYTDMTEPLLRDALRTCPALALERIWESGDVRPGRDTERWLNCLCRSLPAGKKW